MSAPADNAARRAGASRRVYFADLTHTGTVANADTFPYGLGCIAAYGKAVLGERLEFDIFKTPEELNAALDAARPDLLALSNFTWNHRLTMAFADAVKARWPDCVVIMGGPNICLTSAGRQRFLEQNPSIDVYAKWEGEIAFVELFQALEAAGFDLAAFKAAREALPNLLYLADGELIEGPDARIDDLDRIPSPYLAGYLDKFFAAGLRPLIETTRGCPYACTFCNDSHATRNKVKRRSRQAIDAELAYIAEHMTDAADLMIADLNFGMYQEDVETARSIRRLIDRHGWPKTITTAPGKAHPERVLETVKIINGDSGGVLKFAASMQSTSPEVLSAIRRKNLPMDKLLPLLHADSRDGSDNTEYFTELILGLPLDSSERHLASLRDCIDAMRMNIVNVHQLTLLQGSPMALPEQRAAFGFDVRHRVFVGCIGTYRIGAERRSIAEIEEVVVANNTMSFEDWLECRVLSLLTKIYIDRDYFIEVFGLVRRLGLSSLDLLVHLQRAFAGDYPGLRQTIDGFLARTREKLFDSHDELADFTSRAETVERFARGELGGNELLLYRAQAYIRCMDELHAALQAATLSYLQQQGVLDAELRLYVEQAVEYSRKRKFDLNSFRRPVAGRFGFDFIAAARRNFEVLPAEVRGPQTELQFEFSEAADEEIGYALQQWIYPHLATGDAERIGGGEAAISVSGDRQARLEYGLGKLFHMTNLRLIDRTPRTVAA